MQPNPYGIEALWQQSDVLIHAVAFILLLMSMGKVHASDFGGANAASLGRVNAELEVQRTSLRQGRFLGELFRAFDVSPIFRPLTTLPSPTFISTHARWIAYASSNVIPGNSSENCRICFPARSASFNRPANSRIFSASTALNLPTMLPSSHPGRGGSQTRPYG